MTTSHHPFWVAGSAVTTQASSEIRSPFDGRAAGTVFEAGAEHVETALSAASAVAAEFAGTPVYVRASALAHVSSRLRERGEDRAADHRRIR
ncbi:aldehyde dehydrogenase family protein [Rhodococcus sp. 14-2470-1a]|uniref:aldehyde dehydrogenase family protein n=1 Tax=Rhodococcus sp. 14-2470-1a TaxID=2023150 RepID=UPI00211AD827|nr:MULTISPECIES: aldehyde dehydrogenase family protein [unclassified Rhodococcus (in: high G+C Gram-positive bacteria)]